MIDNCVNLKNSMLCLDLDKEQFGMWSWCTKYQDKKNTPDFFAWGQLETEPGTWKDTELQGLQVTSRILLESQGPHMVIIW